jgi:hypothetical protein
MTPALVRPFLALLLAATFGVRSVAPELMRGCGPGTGIAHHEVGAGEHGHHHGAHQPERCECLGHSIKVVLANPPIRALLLEPALPFPATPPGATALARRAAAEHLLPFAQAPPAARLA